MIIKEDKQVGPAVCCECGEDAKINDSGKWYCAIKSELGIFNIRGYCKKANTVTDKKGKV